MKFFQALERSEYDKHRSNTTDYQAKMRWNFLL